MWLTNMSFSEMEHCMFSKLKICKRSSASLYSCEPEGSAEQNFRVVVKGKSLLLKEKSAYTDTPNKSCSKKTHYFATSKWSRRLDRKDNTIQSCWQTLHACQKADHLKKKKKHCLELGDGRKGSNTVHWWSLEAPNTCSSSLTKQAKN